MMSSLFRVNINWNFFSLFLLGVYLLFPGLSWWSFFAITVSLHQFLLLFYSVGTFVPVRYVFGFLICLQLLIGPMLAYNGLDAYQIGYMKMQLPEEQYFSYVLPAVLCFIIGLHVNSRKLGGEFIDVDKVASALPEGSKLPYYFIVIGFIATFLSSFFSSELAFVIYLIGDLRYIGVFMLVLMGRDLKVLPIAVVYGWLLFYSMRLAMFHDLLIWTFFLAVFLAIRYQPSKGLKLVLTAGFFLATMVIQVTKQDYRSALGTQGEETGIETFTKAYDKNRDESGSLDLNALAKNNIRINQGYIITNIMKTVPERVPHANGGQLMEILISAFLPRVLAPNKLNAGDQSIFMKYSGMPLNKRTAMALSSVGDGYVNFGRVGGVIFMFVLGLFFNFVLLQFSKQSGCYPLLLVFLPLVFYYPVRPDCELQTILGHLVKSCFLLFVLFQMWKKYFKVNALKVARHLSFH